MVLLPVIIARADFVVPAWQHVWPDAHRVSHDTRLPAASLAIVLAGEPQWLAHIRHYSTQQVPVLVCSRTATLEEFRQAMDAGARGYLDLFSSAEVLQRAADTITQGALWIPPALLNNMMAILNKALPSSPVDPFAELSAREQQVARAVSRGMSNKAVARELAISERTVKLHLTSIFNKLKISDRMQLLLLSRQSG